MSQRRTVHVAAILIVLCAWMAARAAPTRGTNGILELVHPGPNDILDAGATFEFRVAQISPPVDRVDVYVNGRLVGEARPGTWTLDWNGERARHVTDVDAIAFAGDVVRDRLHLESRGPVIHEAAEVRLVQLYPVVTRLGGRYIEGLTREQFRVLENGAPVEVRYFSEEPATLSVVLLLDGSESMTDYLPEVQVAALRFLESLSADDRVAVYSFNQRATRVVGFDHTRDEAMAAILDLAVGGSTAVYDAVVQVVEDLDTVRGRKALFLFSDGKDRQSFVSKNRAIEVARRKQVLVYSVATGQDDASIAARGDLKTLSEESGGQFFLVRNASNIGDALEATLRDLRAQYVLGYSPRPGPDGVRDVTVKIEGHPLYNVRHRTMYFYENAEPRSD